MYDGLAPALARQPGVDLVPFALSVRLERAASWLRWCWQESGDTGPAPNDADVAYQAGVGAIERALRLQVDWVLVFSGMYFHPDLIVMLRRAGLKIALLLTESPYESESERSLLKWADVAWTNERTAVEGYRQINPNVFYLPHAYDPARHRPPLDLGGKRAEDMTESELAEWMGPPGPLGSIAEHDVVFVATPFPERVELLEAVDWHGIDLGLYGWWDEVLDERSPLRAHVAGGVVLNDRAAELYRNAKIGLNIFRSSRDFDSGIRISGAESVNPRMLELAGCGVFQISDWRAEVEEIFGESVPTFRTAEHLESLLRHYLSESAGSSRAAHAATAREMVAGRTFDVRAEQLLCDIARVSGTSNRKEP